MRKLLVKIIESLSLTVDMRTELATLVSADGVRVMPSKSGKGINIYGIAVPNTAQLKQHCVALFDAIDSSDNLSYFASQTEDYENPLLYIGPSSTMTKSDRADLFA